MGTIAKDFDFSAGQTIFASEHNANFDEIYNEFNGNIDNDNINSAAAIANSKLNLTSITQDIAMSSSEFLLAKGADVASATSITLGTDGNVFDITGTTNIETITIKQAGTVIWLHFDSALTLVDNTGNLELQGANLSVSAEDSVSLRSDGTNWHLISTTAAATNLAIPSEAQGDILYQNGTIWTRLGAGTSGQFLQTQGAGANPQWANQGFTFKSRTAVDGVSSSSDISFSSTNPNKVIIMIRAHATSDSQITMQFNSLATATYSYTRHGYSSTGAIDNSATTQSSILIGTVDTTTTIIGEMLIYSDPDEDDKVYVNGQFTFHDASGNLTALNLSGHFDNSIAGDTLIDFELDFDNAPVDGDIILYEGAIA